MRRGLVNSCQCFVKNMFLQILPNSQENACNFGPNICRLFQVLAQFLFKTSETEKQTPTQVFYVHFTMFLRTPFLYSTCNGCFPNLALRLAGRKLFPLRPIQSVNKKCINTHSVFSGLLLDWKMFSWHITLYVFGI